jgi:hypothetical protein
VSPGFLSRANPLCQSWDKEIDFANAQKICASAWPDERRFFPEIVMPAKDAWAQPFVAVVASPEGSLRSRALQDALFYHAQRLTRLPKGPA